MRNPIWLCIFCLWPIAASAAEFSSAYTRFDLEACDLVEKGDEYVYGGTWRCSGGKFPDITVARSDDRDMVGFGASGATTCAFRKTFGPLNTALSPVEWRIRDGKPFAAIERWRVVNDENGNTVTWLVVTALKNGEACHAHYVAGSYPDANAQARRAADDLAADFNCENDVPTVDSKVGAPPIEINACRDIARE